MFDPTRPPVWTLAALSATLAFSSLATGQERVALTPKDGHPLVGTLVKPSGTPKGGIVLLPTARNARASFDPLLPRLAMAGFVAIAIDPRADAVPVESAPSRPSDSSVSRVDLEAALEVLVERGAPVDKLAIVGAGTGATEVLTFVASTGMRVKTFVLLSPGRDALIPSKDALQMIAPRPILVIATEDEAEKGARAIKEALPDVELNLLPDRLAFGTGMFGRAPAIEAMIADWVDRMLAQPSAIEIPVSKIVFIDGEVSPGEVPGATKLSVPLGDGTSATIRLSRTEKRLDFGFDMPEPYVRLNEIVIYVDSTGHGGRNIDKSCYRISFNPKNPARKPLLVKRGGLKGFEDTDEKGIVAFARTEEKRRWTAEISLDLARFLPGDLPKTIRLAFQINGQRMSDVRYFPDDAKIPTTPGAWAVAHVR